MKKQITLAAVISMTIFMSSYASPIQKSNFVVTDPVSPDLCYVKMKDGSIRTYHSLTFERGLFVSPHLLANGVEKLSAIDIIEYRTKDVLAVSQSLLKGCKKSSVSTEVLPGFAKLVLSGPINVYVRKVFNGTVAVDQYFLQSGEGDIQAYSPKLIHEMLGNNAAALQTFDQNISSSNLYNRLKDALNVYNSTALTLR